MVRLHVGLGVLLLLALPLDVGAATSLQHQESTPEQPDNSVFEKAKDLARRLQWSWQAPSSYNTWSSTYPVQAPATFAPTPRPTRKPTRRPSPSPTQKPTPRPTLRPTSEPTAWPTLRPTSAPTTLPTYVPTGLPSLTPTSFPSSAAPVAIYQASLNLYAYDGINVVRIFGWLLLFFTCFSYAILIAFSWQRRWLIDKFQREARLDIFSLDETVHDMHVAVLSKATQSSSSSSEYEPAPMVLSKDSEEVEVGVSQGESTDGIYLSSDNVLEENGDKEAAASVDDDPEDAIYSIPFLTSAIRNSFAELASVASIASAAQSAGNKDSSVDHSEAEKQPRIDSPILNRKTSDTHVTALLPSASLSEQWQVPTDKTASSRKKTIEIETRSQAQVIDIPPVECTQSAPDCPASVHSVTSSDATSWSRNHISCDNGSLAGMSSISMDSQPIASTKPVRSQSSSSYKTAKLESSSTQSSSKISAQSTALNKSKSSYARGETRSRPSSRTKLITSNSNASTIKDSHVQPCVEAAQEMNAPTTGEHDRPSSRRAESPLKDSISSDIGNPEEVAKPPIVGAALPARDLPNPNPQPPCESGSENPQAKSDSIATGLGSCILPRAYNFSMRTQPSTQRKLLGDSSVSTSSSNDTTSAVEKKQPCDNI